MYFKLNHQTNSLTSRAPTPPFLPSLLKHYRPVTAFFSLDYFLAGSPKSGCSLNKNLEFEKVVVTGMYGH
jgi:hypothetical protein